MSHSVSSNGRPAARLTSTARGPVELAESGDGPLVIALHGAMGGWDQSDLLARTVGEPGYRTIALSRPGYLGTPLSSGPTAREQADLYAATLDALGVRRAAVMAVSGGGPSAIHFALRHPERCWAMVLVSTCGSPTRDRPPLAFRLMMKALGRWPGLGRLLTLRKPDAEKAARRSIPDPGMRRRTLGDPEAGPLFREMLDSTSARVSERIAGTEVDIAESSSFALPLEQVRVPVLVVHGTADRLLPFGQHGMELATRIPGAELVRAEGGDHVSIFTHRELIRPRVAAFLRAHAPSGNAQE